DCSPSASTGAKGVRVSRVAGESVAIRKKERFLLVWPVRMDYGAGMRWKTALHSVSYAGVWPGQARLSLEGFLERAQVLGFDAVMLMAKRPHLSVLDYDSEARNRLRGLLQRLGLQVACLAGYTDFCMGSERPDIPNREMQILYVRELSRLARS